MNVSREGYRGMSAIVRALAEELCGGRLVFVLEGGYAASGLRDGVDAVLEVMLADTTPEVPETTSVLPKSTLEQVIEVVSSVHPS